MMVSPMQKMSLRVRGLLNDRSGLAAVEFAMVFPIMVVLYFGVVEFSSAIAVDRKATQVARTLSDLTSQSISVGDADIKNFGEAAKAIMTPYPPSPLVSSITEVYIDSVSGIARVQWSKGLTIGVTGDVSIAATAPHNPGDVVTLPTNSRRGQGDIRDLERGQLQIYAGGRNCAGADRHNVQGCLLYAPAPRSLRSLSDGWLLHLSTTL